jgi:hypothetical protein
MRAAQSHTPAMSSLCERPTGENHRPKSDAPTPTYRGRHFRLLASSLGVRSTESAKVRDLRDAVSRRRFLEDMLVRMQQVV